MANELNIALAKSGLTVTAQPYQNGSAVGSAISCPETSSTGFYSGNMTGTAGTYQIAFRSAGAFNPASDTVATVTTLTNAPTVPTPSQIASQVRTELSSELAKVSALNTTRLGQCTTTEILGNLLAQANS
jgi:hypothetical protein